MRSIGYIEFDWTEHGEERVILYNLMKLGFDIKAILRKDQEDTTQPKHANLLFQIISKEEVK